MPYKRKIVNVIISRINERRRFIQIVVGPRQTGKTNNRNAAFCVGEPSRKRDCGRLF